jgi:transcriptional regulator with XRE-family HTH domain
MDMPKVFGQYLRDLRIDKGMKGIELARLCNYHRSYISSIELGKKGIPSPHTLALLATGLDVPYVQLMLKAGHLTIDDSNNLNLKEIVPMPKMEISPFAPQLPKHVFGEYLKQARIAGGFELDQISDRVNIASSTLELYEAGRIPATLATLRKMERWYGLKRYELTDRAGYKNRDPEHQPKEEYMNPPKLVETPVPPVASGNITIGSAPNAICAELLDEVVRARMKHPKSLNSPHEGYAVLQEEMEELWDAIKQDDFGSARAELIQVGAMAIRFLLDVELKPTKPVWAKAPGTVERVTPKRKWFSWN